MIVVGAFPLPSTKIQMNFYRNQNGIALFMVLWVLVLLTVIVGEFCYAMRTEINITKNFIDTEKAYYIAKAGINNAIMGLLDFDTDLKNMHDQPVQQIWRVNREMKEVGFGGGKFKITIGNESGKISINTANAKLLKILLQSFELADEEQLIIIDSIQDWRDADNFHRINGAEEDYYQALLDPYHCANRPFQAIEELALVRGMTPVMVASIAEIITTHQEKKAKSKNKRKRHKKVPKEKSQDKININAAPTSLLRLFPKMTESVVEDVVAYRMEKDFLSLNDFKEVVGSEVFTAVSRFITVDFSPFFTIDSLGIVDNSSVRRNLRTTIFIDKEKKDYQMIEWLDKIQ